MDYNKAPPLVIVVPDPVPDPSVDADTGSVYCLMAPYSDEELRAIDQKFEDSPQPRVGLVLPTSAAEALIIARGAADVAAAAQDRAALVDQENYDLALEDKAVARRCRYARLAVRDANKLWFSAEDPLEDPDKFPASPTPTDLWPDLPVRQAG